MVPLFEMPNVINSAMILLFAFNFNLKIKISSDFLVIIQIHIGQNELMNTLERCYIDNVKDYNQQFKSISKSRHMHFQIGNKYLKGLK